MVAFIYGVCKNSPRPTMTWDWYNGTEFGNLTVYTSEKPVEVKVWYADTIQDERLVDSFVFCEQTSILNSAVTGVSSPAKTRAQPLLCLDTASNPSCGSRIVFPPWFD